MSFSLDHMTSSINGNSARLSIYYKVSLLCSLVSSISIHNQTFKAKKPNSAQEIMSLLYHIEGDHMRRNQDVLMDSNPHYNHQIHQHQHQQQQINLQQYQNSVNVEDYQYYRPSSPEIDTFLSKYMLTSNNSGDSCSQNLQQQFTELAVKKEHGEMMYRSSENHNETMENFMVLESKMSPGNEVNLIRQSSSPAGFFSNLGVDNGFASRSNMAQISEIASQNKSNNGSNGSNRQYSTNFDICFGVNTYETQNDSNGNRSNGLIHQLSLPNTSSEIGAAEKYLHFQNSIPCKIRAKRGFATHPRSIAERVRRTRISQKMRKLQDLCPNMDKQTNTAEMLDLAVEFIKDLQKQVKNLSNTRAKCICSHEMKQ